MKSEWRAVSGMTISGLFVAGLAFMLIFCLSTVAAQEILYDSNFQDVPDGELPSGFRTAGGTWAVQSGRLVGESASHVNGQVVFGDAEWSSFEMEATIRYLSAASSTRWAAAIYRAPEHGGSDYFLFTIRYNAAANNGMELAYNTPGDTWNVHLTTAWHEPLQLNRPYHLRVVAHDTRAVYYFEGEKVLETDFLITNPAGTLGFVTNGTKIAVEDVVVRTLSDEQIGEMERRSARGATPTIRQTGVGPAPLVIAHRGASGVRPENTMAAFQLAADLGADLIETDTYLSADGHVVLMHDANVNRTTTGPYTGAITNLTLEQIRTLDAGSWKSPEFRGEKVPTLEEALSELQGEAMFLVENKQTGIESHIARVIRDTGMERSVVFQSFDADSVKAFRQLMPDVPAALLFSDPKIENEVDRAATLLSQALEAGAQVVAVNHGAISPGFVRYIQNRGLSVWTWTVNSENDMRRVLAAGVNGIITDYPERLLHIVNEEFAS